MARKSFTVQEADALVPVLEDVLARLEAARDRARGHHDRLQVLELLWGDRVHEPGNPDHREALGERTDLVDEIRELERLIDEEILDRGIRFPQGGLEHGLLDFPTTWEGRWVYLCWQRGEPSVATWHEVDGGFAGRRPLTGEQRRRMGREDDPGALDDSGMEF